MSEEHKKVLAALNEIEEILIDYGLVGSIAIASIDGIAGNLLHLEAPFSNIERRDKQFVFMQSVKKHPQFEDFLQSCENTEDAMQALRRIMLFMDSTLDLVQAAHKKAKNNLIADLQFRADLNDFIRNDN